MTSCPRRPREARLVLTYTSTRGPEPGLCAGARPPSSGGVPCAPRESIHDRACEAMQQLSTPGHEAGERQRGGLVTTRRTYVLDTSVLLSDPGALMRFGDSDVVLPLVVIGELEDKRNHPELG